MPSSAESGRDCGGVDGVGAASHHDEDPLVHLDEQHESASVREIDDLVSEIRDAVDVLRPGQRRDEHLLSVRRDGLEPLHQRIEERPLLGC